MFSPSPEYFLMIAFLLGSVGNKENKKTPVNNYILSKLYKNSLKMYSCSFIEIQRLLLLLHQHSMESRHHNASSLRQVLFFIIAYPADTTIIIETTTNASANTNTSYL